MTRVALLQLTTLSKKHRPHPLLSLSITLNLIQSLLCCEDAPPDFGLIDIAGVDVRAMPPLLPPGWCSPQLTL